MPAAELPATDPAVVAQEARLVAAAWSAPGAPGSWRLTAEQFGALAGDEELLAIAATIAPARLPALLFEAAATFLVLELEPQPLRNWFPRVGEPQAALGATFRREYRDFCLDNREALLELCARHRYQMNEVGRCAEVVPALAPAARSGRDVVLVDLGTGAGLGLHLDRYRYVYRRPGGEGVSVGERSSAVTIDVELRGAIAPPIPPALPNVVDRVGIDVEPLELADPSVRGWLAACVPQEIGAVTRFHNASETALRHPARKLRGDVCDVLPDLLRRIPDGPLVCLVDSYVGVFFTAERLARLRAVLARAGAERDLDWVSVDPLMPMGSDARESVAGIPVPPALVRRNRRKGVFGLVARVGYRDGRREAALLGVAHPGAAWLEWLEPGAGARRGRSTHRG